MLGVHHTPSGDRQEWKDSPECKIETILGEFFDFIIDSATKARDKRLEQEMAEKKAEEERQYKLNKEAECKARKDKFKALQREEKQKLEKLRSDSRAWFESQRVRQYIDAVKQQISSSGVPASPELLVWIKDSLQFADRIDPLAETPPSIIDMVLDDKAFQSNLGFD